MKWYANGTLTGTGAAINKIIGFKPGRVEISNPKTGRRLIWTDDMADGAGMLEGDLAKAAAVLSSPRCAIGTTKDNVANSAFTFEIAGVKYLKAAVTAGTGPTATVIPEDKWGLFGFEIAANGTIAGKDAAGNATGYATEALAIAALPAASASNVLFMYVTVMKSDGDFTGATTEFDATGVTAHFYNVDTKNSITTGGITPYSTLGYGFTLGTNADINVSGDTLYYEVWRADN